MKKLNGYRPTHRNKWLLIKSKLLSVQELSLLEFYADIVDFDKEHNQFGTFDVYFNEICSYFDRKEGIVRQWHNKLLELGFIQETERLHTFKLACFHRYINPGAWGGKAAEYVKKEKDQPVEIILQSFGLNFQTVKEKIQNSEKKKEIRTDDKSQIDSIAIGSSKDEYKFASNSSKDYTSIKQELGFELLTEEDMKWIDENVTENVNVPTKQYAT